MNLIYPFDSERYQLGRLCKHGHKWPGTELSLRIKGRCKECEKKINSEKRQRRLQRMEADPAFREAMRTKDQRRGQEERRRMAQDPERLAQARERSRVAMAQRRAIHGRPSRAKSGEFATALECREVLRLRRGIQESGRYPSVAALVMAEQRAYWKECPEAFDKYDRERRRRYAQWRQMTDLRYRIYQREKSKRRKAQARGQTPVAISVNALLTRFGQFGNCCAYCGCAGDMEIEHVVPISRGGAHDISNIVPACAPCNSSKSAKEMEAWYKGRRYFCELRLQRIRRIVRPPMALQLAFA
jgi:5-methylcytosine-specific restriction endonuclease McrA